MSQGTAGAACPWGPSRPPASGWMDGSTGSNRTGSIVSSMETVLLLWGVGRAGAPIPVEGCLEGCSAAQRDHVSRVINSSVVWPCSDRWAAVTGCWRDLGCSYHN